MNGIVFGIDENGNYYSRSQFQKELNANENEMKIAEHFISVSGNKITLERRADNYLSLCNGQDDLIRFKFTDRSKWISVDAWTSKLPENDIRFSAHKNKKQRFWKADIRSLDDISMFDDIVARLI